MKVGFIGLGIMGSRMAANLQKAGYDLVVYNRTKDKGDDLVASGAQWGDNPAAAADGVDVLVTMLAAPDTVARVAFGVDGFMETLPDGALWINSTTVNPSFAMQMAETVAEQDIRYLDAPVAGSVAPAASGDLIFLVGGKEADIEEARPLLEAMGSEIRHAGPAGAGSAMKVVANMVLAQGMATFVEALALGQSLGIPKGVLLDSLLSSAITPPYLKGKREKIEKELFETEFPLSLMYKDLHLATTTAYENQVPLPLANAAKEAYALAIKQGLGDEDFSAIYKLLNRSETS